MTLVGMVDGVRIFRPLLEFNKDIIVEFAHTFGVPYFKDTTPQWSVRGKLRNQLMPYVFWNRSTMLLYVVDNTTDSLIVYLLYSMYVFLFFCFFFLQALA